MFYLYQYLLRESTYMQFQTKKVTFCVIDSFKTIFKLIGNKKNVMNMYSDKVRMHVHLVMLDSMSDNNHKYTIVITCNIGHQAICHKHGVIIKSCSMSYGGPNVIGVPRLKYTLLTRRECLSTAPFVFLHSGGSKMITYEAKPKWFEQIMDILL